MCRFEATSKTVCFVVAGSAARSFQTRISPMLYIKNEVHPFDVPSECFAERLLAGLGRNPTGVTRRFF